MAQLCISTIATDLPMGAQVYQEQIASRAATALSKTDVRPWRVRRQIVRSLRSSLPGTTRLPFGAVASASPTLRRAVGAVLHARDTVSHRMNLELPPAPSGDVVTLHDVVAWKFPDESAPVPAAAAELRRADAVICVSEFSAGEAVDLLGIRNPHIVHNGVDERFFDPEPADDELLSRLGIHPPFVLTAGGAARRKNPEGLAAAWALVAGSKSDLSLVLAGPEHPRRSELFGPLPRTRLVGRLPDEVMPRLYAAAAAIVVPSLYEGFGLPALEGMAASRPVVAAETSSLPEVVGDGGLLVTPTPEGIAEGILAAVSGSADMSRMAARGRARAGEFTWDRSALAHARVWTSLGL